MPDTSDAELQYGQNAAAARHSIRTADFEHASHMRGSRRPARRGLKMLLALGLLFIGVLCFFVVLRVLFEPGLLGGKDAVMLVIPLAIFGCFMPLYFGTRILLRTSQHR